MNTGQKAELYVKEYFKDKKKIKLISAPRGELGYDFKTSDNKLFIEVKGTAATKLTKVYFRYFTNTEYEKARACRKAKVTYEIHLILGVNSDSISHYKIPGNLLLEKGKPEIAWALPIRKEHHDYLVIK
jgi:hypothetical protein